LDAGMPLDGGEERVVREPEELIKHEPVVTHRLVLVKHQPEVDVSCHRRREAAAVREPYASGLMLGKGLSSALYSAVRARRPGLPVSIAVASESKRSSWLRKRSTA